MSWGQKAWAVVVALSRTGEEFTSDDVIEQVGMPDGSHKPNGANNAMGPLFARAHTQGLIEPVGTAQSKSPTRKGGLIRTWRGKQPPNNRLEFNQ